MKKHILQILLIVGLLLFIAPLPLFEQFGSTENVYCTEEISTGNDFTMMGSKGCKIGDKIGEVASDGVKNNYLFMFIKLVGLVLMLGTLTVIITMRLFSHTKTKH